MNDHWIFKEFFGSWWKDIWSYTEKGKELEFLESDKYLNELQYQESEQISILHTTYQDNDYLTEQDIQDLINEDDKYYFEVYTLGRAGVLGAVIYKNYKVEEFKKESFSNYRHAVDWGFSPDPFAYLRMAVDLTRKKIYICDEVYMTDLSNYNSAQVIKPLCLNEVVFCDSAEPKSVLEYQTYDINAVSVEKGPGSVEVGIKFLQDFEIIIHPSCPNFESEIKKYKRKEMKDGTVLPQPADRQADHLMDTMRYGISEDIVLISPTITIL